MSNNVMVQSQVFIGSVQEEGKPDRIILGMTHNGENIAVPLSDYETTVVVAALSAAIPRLQAAVEIARDTPETT